MKKYVILVNNGLYGGGIVFDREGLEKVINEWSGGKELIDEDDEVVSIEDLIEIGSMGEMREICNEEMVERGGDYVEVSICELIF
jgi:hypothetical protein